MPTENDRGQGLHSVEGMFKDVCDGGLVPVEHKHQEPFTAPAIARCVFATNTLPRFYDKTLAMWDRLRIIPFNKRFRGTEHENRNLRHEIVDEELPGVFSWALQGLALLQDDKQFPEHSEGLSIKEDHKNHCDPEGIFLHEFYEKSRNGDYVSTAAVYEKYSKWIDDNGYRRKSEGNFSKDVVRKFHVHKTRERIDNGQKTVYNGLSEKFIFEANY